MELLHKGGVPHGLEEHVYKELLTGLGFSQDQFGNYYKLGESDVLLTAHLDTVHDVTNFNQVEYRIEDYVVKSAGKAPLGADDKAGVALVLYLAERLPVNYALFIGEEKGLVGSNKAALAYEYDMWVMTDLKAVISLDRKGVNNIVNSQLGMPCASYEFVLAVQEELPFLTRIVPGSFTDSAAFMDLVPNVTNISVGYYDQHTNRESQNLLYLDKLGESLLQVDWEKLAIVSEAYPVLANSSWRKRWRKEDEKCSFGDFWWDF